MITTKMPINHKSISIVSSYALYQYEMQQNTLITISIFFTVSILSLAITLYFISKLQLKSILITDINIKGIAAN